MEGKMNEIDELFAGPNGAEQLLEEVDDETFVTIKVPTTFVNSLAEPGCRTVENIESDSGARIIFYNPSSSPTSKILIYGTYASRTLCLHLIEAVAGFEICSPPQSPKLSRSRVQLQVEAEDRSRKPRPSLQSEARAYPQAEAQAEALVDAHTEGKTEGSMDSRAQEIAKCIIVIQDNDEDSIEVEEDHRLIKDIYEEHPDTAAMTPDEVKQWRKTNNDVLVIPPTIESASPAPHIPNPIITFERGFSNYPSMLQNIRRQGFNCPTPIQAQAWPIILGGHDLIAVTPIGTGKTLAFALPALIHVDVQPVVRVRLPSPNVLVLAPTKDLAFQIQREFDQHKFRGVRTICAYGFNVKLVFPIDRKYYNHVNVLIDTPTHFLEMIQSGFLSIESFTFLVIDEIDQIIDIGIAPLLCKALIGIRKDCQTIITTSNLSRTSWLTSKYTTDPFQIVVGSPDLTSIRNVTQELVFLKEADKLTTLLDYLKHLEEDETVVVFCATKNSVCTLSAEMREMKLAFLIIRTGFDIRPCEFAVKQLSDGAIKILLVTHKGSRGLIDFKNTPSIVINYDFPANMDEYVHRVKKTGCQEKPGKAISYLTHKDWDKATSLTKVMKESDQDLPDELVDMSKRFEAMIIKKKKAKMHKTRHFENA